jgi:transposase-like protein/predicted RNA-binding Zn-ribbon protein involved in translation (DUF1610 family)
MLVVECQGRTTSSERSISIPASATRNLKKVVTRKFSRRALRGLAIVATGGQIRRVNDRLFFVKSQTHYREHRVEWSDGGWSCDCEDYLNRKRDCKHVYAVLYALSLPDILLANSEALERSCPYCGSNDVLRDGSRKNKFGIVQIYLCSTCGRKFREGIGGEVKGRKALFMLLALDLFCKGVSLRDIRNHIWQIYNVTVPTSTIHSWVVKLTQVILKVSGKLEPEVADRWLADEMVINVNGKRMYLWNIIDYKTRFHIASLLSESRGEEEACRVLTEAIRVAGKAPRELVTDGLASYKKGIQRAQKNGIRIKHISNVGITKEANNNRIERRHGGIRTWIRIKRGMKERAGELIAGNVAYYNFIRPHMSLGDEPPCQISETNRWLSLLRKTIDIRRNVGKPADNE